MDELKETQKSVGKKKRSDTVLNWVLINIGTLALAVGVYFFKAPNNFATGGVSGLSIILVPALQNLPFFKNLASTEIMTITNLALNVLLLVVGFIFLGRGCTFKTAYCSIVYSVEAWLLKFIPLPLPLTNQVFLEFVIAMLTTGIGSAILFNCGASSGGTDIIALIIKKFAKVNIGIALTVADFIIACSAFFVFKENAVQIGLYSVLGLFAKSFLVDGVIENIGKNKFLTIITEDPEKIRDYILVNMHRGYTAYKAKGGFSGAEKTVIITVCKRSEALKLKTQINKVDPTAFVIFTDTTEIIGKGFKDRF